MSGDFDFWLFDLDGTLIDVDPGYIEQVVTRVGERIGYQFSSTQAEQLWHGLGGSPDELLDRWNIDRKTFWEAFHAVEDPQERASSTFLYPDAHPIASLECPVGLVTHCQPYLVNPVLSSLDIADWFDIVVCCGDELGWKPDPTPVEYAIDGLGVTDSTGIMVGDSPHDVGAAWNAGLTGAHVERHGPRQRGCCVWADHRVTTIDAMMRTV